MLSPKALRHAWYESGSPGAEAESRQYMGAVQDLQVHGVRDMVLGSQISKYQEEGSVERTKGEKGHSGG